MALLASTLPAGTKYATPQELLSLFAENLSVPASDASVFVLSTTAPNDQSKIWLDSSTANPTLKIYNGGWVSISAQNTFTSGFTVSGGNIRLINPSLSIDNTGTYAGRVGIGTETPTTKLDVVGAIKTDTSVTTPALIHPTSGTLAITGGLSTTGGITMSSGSLSITAGAITASGNITSSGGTVSATAINVGTGAITGGSLSLTAASINSAGLLTAANITTGGVLTAGSIVLPAATVTTDPAQTVTTGAAATLPARPEGYLSVSINGTVRKIPYYKNT
jgi:hypothetical protein